MGRKCHGGSWCFLFRRGMTKTMLRRLNGMIEMRGIGYNFGDVYEKDLGEMWWGYGIIRVSARWRASRKVDYMVNIAGDVHGEFSQGSLLSEATSNASIQFEIKKAIDDILKKMS